ncbi:MAG: maleylpyruvate isomerase family mycothiol-dependent enzyme [Deltaproteobacteria bacterium]|nr:maleylpyruvate isomerase family mycothiol-dependent enzyme [Deltaproteobacteria bacterium]
MEAICNDLAAEHEALDAIVADIEEERWSEITPFSGWSIQDEISHVAYFDYAGRLAAADSDAFAKHVEELTKDIQSPSDIHPRALKKGRDMRPPQLLEWWREERKAMLAEFEKHDPKDRLPWYGPSMSARSFATARLMETWAHGLDVADVPTQPVRVELNSPSGDIWTWGPEETEDVVRGNAEEFCMTVVRRRHVDDTHLEMTGDVAVQWMSIAQAFAGPPEKRPETGSFPKLDI